MTFQSTIASIQNIRKQRQLELDLLEIDRKWHVELKGIARERLAAVKELCRIQRDQREADHFRYTLRGKDLVSFTDRAQGRRQLDREFKQVHKFNFEPDPVEKMNLQLPLMKDDSQDELTGQGGASEAAGEDVGRVITAKDLTKYRIQLQKTTTEQCTADRRSRRRPFWDKAVLGSKKKQTPRDRNGFFRNLSRGSGSLGPQKHVEVFREERPSGGRGRVGGVWGNDEEGEGENGNGVEADKAIEEGVDGSDIGGKNNVIRTDRGIDLERTDRKGIGAGDRICEEIKQRRGRRSRNGQGRGRIGEERTDSGSSTVSTPNSRRGPFKTLNLPPLKTLRRPDGFKVKTVHASLSDRRSASVDYLPVLRASRGQHKESASPKSAFSSSSTLPSIPEA